MQQLRRACAELERRLRAGEPCRAEDWLAAHPALAVAANGVMGLLYTRLTGTGADQRMSTEFYRQSASGMGGRTDVLATWPKNTPARVYHSYIGDYQQVVAVGNIFYGTFSASNEVKRANFPSGVFYQRNVKIGGEVKNNLWLRADGDLDDGSGPPPQPGARKDPSIDPFFFSVSTFGP